MKVGPLDGSVEEVKDLFENHGLKLEDYLEKPLPQLQTIFLIIPVALMICALILLSLLAGSCSHSILTLIYLLCFGIGTWLAVSTQLRFKNTIASFAVAIGTILMVLVASGIFSPKDAAEFLRKFFDK